MRNVMRWMILHVSWGKLLYKSTLVNQILIVNALVFSFVLLNVWFGCVKVVKFSISTFTFKDAYLFFSLFDLIIFVVAWSRRGFIWASLALCRRLLSQVFLNWTIILFLIVIRSFLVWRLLFPLILRYLCFHPFYQHLLLDNILLFLKSFLTYALNHINLLYL